jgi:hypothetical protein
VVVVVVLSDSVPDCKRESEREWASCRAAAAAPPSSSSRTMRTMLSASALLSEGASWRTSLASSVSSASPSTSSRLHACANAALRSVVKCATT